MYIAGMLGGSSDIYDTVFSPDAQVHATVLEFTILAFGGRTFEYELCSDLCKPYSNERDGCIKFHYFTFLNGCDRQVLKS